MKTGTLIKLLKKELKAQGILQGDVAAKLNYSEAYVNRMLRSPKMSTELFEEILDASGVTLQDLARREAADIVVDDIGGRFSALEGFMQAIQAESLPDRVAKLESQMAILQRKHPG